MGIAAFGFGVYLYVTNADPEFALLMALYGAFVLIGTVSDAIASTFVGLERMAAPAAANVIARVVGTVVAIIVLLLGGDAVSVVAVAVGANLLAFAILYRAVRHVTSIVIRGWSSHAAAIVRASSGFLVAVTVLTVYQQIDTVVIALLVDDEVLGWYSTADQLFSTLLFPITILMGAVFPTLGRLHSAAPEELIVLVRRAFRSLLVIAVPIGLGTTIVAPQFALLLLGEEFRETGYVLAVLGPVIILTFGSILFGTLAMATERQRFWNMVMVVGVVLTIPLDLVLVPWADRAFSNGAIGGAPRVRRHRVHDGAHRFVEDRSVPRRPLDRVAFARTAIAGALMFASAWALRDSFILLPIAAGAAVYIVTAIALRVIGDDERMMIGTILAKWASRRRGRSGPMTWHGDTHMAPAVSWPA